MNSKMSLLFLCLIITISSFSIVAEDSPSVLVKTVLMKKETVAHTVTGYGSIEADPKYIKNIFFNKTGRISRLTASVGEFVKEGSPLFEFTADPTMLQAYNQALIALDLAEKEDSNTKKLLELKLATQSQYAATQKTLIDAKNQVSLQEKLGNNISQEEVLAPFDAIILSLNGLNGDIIPIGTNAAQVAAVGKTRAKIGLNTAVSKSVKPGMKAVVFSFYNSTQYVETTVSSIYGKVNPQTFLVDVLLSIPENNANDWIIGSAIEATISIFEEEGWTVPRQAVLQDNQGQYIFQISNNSAIRKNVTTGIENNGMLQIKGEFDPKIPVVISGNYELINGMKVREK